MKFIFLFSIFIVFVILPSGIESHSFESGNDTAKYCMVTGESIEGNGVVFRYLDSEINVCCDGCVMAFNKEPARYLKKRLLCAPCKDEDANPEISHLHKGVKYYFCSNGCKAEFADDAEKYLAKFNK